VQIFWAILNHKYHDWFLDGVFFTLFCLYIFKPSEKSRTVKSLECVALTLCLLFVILVINHILFSKYVKIRSLSPSLKCEDFIRLNHLLPFLKTKSISFSSFPGDHATFALFFYFISSGLFNKNLMRFLSFYTPMIILPRLIIGAHNLSDVLIGSMLIAYPIAYFIVYFKLIEKMAIFIKNKSLVLLGLNRAEKF
jgi:membrane-associated phospholipid phosphatase